MDLQLHSRQYFSLESVYKLHSLFSDMQYINYVCIQIFLSWIYENIAVQSNSNNIDLYIDNLSNEMFEN